MPLYAWLMIAWVAASFPLAVLIGKALKRLSRRADGGTTPLGVVPSDFPAGSREKESYGHERITRFRGGARTRRNPPST